MMGQEEMGRGEERGNKVEICAEGKVISDKEGNGMLRDKKIRGEW